MIHSFNRRAENPTKKNPTQKNQSMKNFATPKKNVTIGKTSKSASMVVAKSQILEMLKKLDETRPGEETACLVVYGSIFFSEKNQSVHFSVR